jgi:hypothetical protein
MLWVNIITLAVSVTVFVIIDSKANISQKVYNRIKINKPAHRILYYICALFVLGTLSAIVGIVVMEISGNELLADIIRWAFIGVGIGFCVGVPLFREK